MTTGDLHMPDAVFKRFYSHLKTAVTILQLYDGIVPFAHCLKNYFSQYKKFGGRDRKQIAELCYGYFRLGRSYPQLTIEQKTVMSYSLSQNSWAEDWQRFFSSFGLPKESPDNIFPFADYLSAGIDSEVFISQHLIQPDLFLRARPGRAETVMNQLKAAGIPFISSGSSLQLANSVRIEPVIRVNRDAVVQDLSSQRLAEMLQLYQRIQQSDIVPEVWDCCAASGGKSILAVDTLPQLELTVSDIRPSILSNLKRRFREAALKDFRAFVADVTRVNPGRLFDLIIADVPCSGSGTWARTPEQLTYFEAHQIDAFAKLQTDIGANIIKYLKPGGYLLYITCSVFSKENEWQVQLLENAGLRLVEQRFFKGYENKADTMFGALLQAVG